jgi:eukaryotic-like serine/threonine-protein kinase
VDGRYTIVEQIGEGGMGAVYRAQHQRLGRQVAIKFLHHEFAKHHEALDRFFNEARAAATLGHPNIAESFDMGELASGAPFIVLELLKGRSVHDEVGRVGPLSIRRALRIARQIALGLDAAHQRGIIHRDLKAENVFLTDREENPDHVKILDFGVARVLENTTNITKPGLLIGTPEVMPPEQIISPDTIDARVDIYAAGAILYQMLSGQKPYGAMPLPALLHKILEESPPPLTSLPEDARRLVEDAMARDRNQRIQTMTELRDRIDACMIAMSSPATPLQTRVPTDVIAVAEAAAAAAAAAATEAAVPSHLVLPRATTSSPTQGVDGSGRRPVVLGLGAGSAIALAGVLFAVFHSGGSSSLAGAPAAASPPPPAQVATAPAPAALPQPSAKPVEAREVAPAPSEAPPPPDPTPEAAEPRPTAPVDPPATVAHLRASTARGATAHPGPRGTHAQPARQEVAATPAMTAPSRPIVGSPEALPAHDPGAAEPGAATPPVEHGPVAAVASRGSGAPAETPAVAPAPTLSGPAAPAVKKDEIDVAATRAAVRTHVAAIQQCYERAKMDDQSLAGAMTVRITIAPDGAVTATQVTKSTIGSPVVERCVTAEISRWQLPKPTGGNTASLLYPFVFE